MGFVFMVVDASQHYYTEKGLFKTVKENNPRDAWYFSTLSSGKKESINIQPAETGDGLMAFLNLFMGKVDAPIGVAGVGINLDHLSQELKKIRLSTGGTTYLIGSGGTMKAHPRCIHGKTEKKY